MKYLILSFQNGDILHYLLVSFLNCKRSDTDSIISMFYHGHIKKLLHCLARKIIIKGWRQQTISVFLVLHEQNFVHLFDHRLRIEIQDLLLDYCSYAITTCTLPTNWIVLINSSRKRLAPHSFQAAMVSNHHSWSRPLRYPMYLEWKFYFSILMCYLIIFP